VQRANGRTGGKGRTGERGEKADDIPQKLGKMRELEFNGQRGKAMMHKEQQGEKGS
jgi:hypothetical protein